MSRTARLLAFLLGVAVFAAFVLLNDPKTLLAGLRSAGWVLAILVPLWGVTYICNAIAWQLLTSKGGERLPFFRAYTITILSFAINYATPLFSLGGEPLKIALAANWLGQRRAAGSVVAFRLLHGLSHILVFTLALIPAAIVLPHTPAIMIGIGCAFVGFVAAAAFLLSRHREGLFVHLLGLLGRIPLLRRLAVKLEPKRESLHEMDAHLTAIITSSPKRFYLALAVEMVGRIISMMEFVVILHGMHLGADPIRAFVVGNFSSLVSNLMIFIPYELGSKEGSLYLVFKWLGFEPALGIQASLLSRMREVVWVGIGIVLIWAMGGRPRVRSA